MDNISDVVKYLTNQDYETKLKYYDRLGFHLTIAIRSIWSNPDLSDKEKIEAIKVINELSHRIFNWTWRLKGGDKTFNDAACFFDIKQLAQQDKNVAGEIGEAVMSSYKLHNQSRGSV